MSCRRASTASATNAHHRDVPARAAKETPHAGSAKRSGSTHHEVGTNARHTQLRSPSVLAFRRQRDRSHPHANFVNQDNAKAYNRSQQEPRCPFTAPIPSPRRSKTLYGAYRCQEKNRHALSQLPRQWIAMPHSCSFARPRRAVRHRSRVRRAERRGA